VAGLQGCVTDRERLPHSLRAAAETGAARFGNDAAAHRQYFDNFRRGAIDALIWAGEAEASREASAAACERGADRQLRLIECAYADGADVVLKGAAVTLADLDYRPATGVGRIAARTDSPLRHVVMTPPPRRWLLAASPVADRLETGACYRLTGYLAPQAPDPVRFPDVSGEFIALEAVEATACDVPAGR